MRKAKIAPTAIIEPNTMPRIAPTFMTGPEAEGGFPKGAPGGVELALAEEDDCAAGLVPAAGFDVLIAVVDKDGKPSVTTNLESAIFAFGL